MIGQVLVTHTVDPIRLLESIPKDVDRGLWIVFTHGQDTSISSTISTYLRDRKGCLFDYRDNRGLARSWNDALIYGRDRGVKDFLLLNDDLFFYEHGYENFVKYAARACESNDVGLVTPLGLESGSSINAGQVHPQAFACSMISRHAISKVGFFDETFFPAYFEDCDYKARIERAGLRHLTFQEIILEHDRSSTIRTAPELVTTHRDDFERNRLYFTAKWGQYDKPDTFFQFAFDDAANSVYIGEDKRRNPYPDETGIKWRRVGSHQL